MDINTLKKNVRSFLQRDQASTSPKSAAAKKSKAIIGEKKQLSDAQEKLYGALTADNGFSIADARRHFLGEAVARSSNAETK